MLEAFVQTQQPLVGGQLGVGEAQGVGPGGAGGVGHGHLGQEQGRVHGLRAARAQHGGQDRARGDIYRDGHLGSAEHPVVE
ncbi:hypothetical protein GCM10010501_15100 [Streptomyces libani subsp. rufus]|nr:hypothetical protein GCM10010501_15100 [Streptomyces libani subsp. rufus]